MSKITKRSTEQYHLDALSKNFPNGYLFRLQIDAGIPEQMGVSEQWYKHIECVYLSPSWEQVSSIPRDEAMRDFFSVWRIHTDDIAQFTGKIYESLKNCSPFNDSVRYYSDSNEVRWVQVSAQTSREGNLLVYDGFALDVTNQKQIELELEAERGRIKRLGGIVANCAFYRLVYDTETSNYKAIDLSDNWEVITNISNTEAMLDINKMYESIHPDDLPFLNRMEQDSLRTMNNFSCEVRLASVYPYRWILLTSRPFRKDKLVIWDGMMLDITQRKHIEQRLIEENNRFESLSNNLPTCALYQMEYCIATSTRRMTYLSANWEQIVSISLAETLAEPMALLKVLSIDDAQRFCEYERECVEQMSDLKCEVRLAQNQRWLLVAAHPRIEENRVVWDGIVHDITERKQMEQRLVDENNRLESLSDNLRDGCLLRCEIDTNCLTAAESPLMLARHLHLSYISASWEEISNIQREKAMRNVMIPLMKIHSSDRKKMLTDMYNSIVQRGRMDVEVRYLYSDTETRWLRIVVSARNENNLVVCDGFVFNITANKMLEAERQMHREGLELLVSKRTEELETAYEEQNALNQELSATNEELAQKNVQLEESENKLQGFINQSHEGIMIFDSDGRIMEWNPSMEKISGIAASDAIGKLEWDLRWQLYSKEQQTPEERDRLHRHRLEFIHSNSPAEIRDINIYRSDGTTRYVRTSLFRVITKDYRYFGRIVRDITWLHKAEIELAHYRSNLEQMVATQTKEIVASKERLTSLSNNLPGGIVYQMQEEMDGRDAQFTYVSDVFTDIFGIKSADLLANSSNFFKYIHPDDIEALMKSFKTAGDSGYIDTEVRIILKEDDMRWIHLRVAYHVNDDRMRIWDGFMIDVTSRKNTACELEKSIKQQNILIKTLQTVNSTKEIQQGINSILKEIGEYVGVSRVYIFEKNPDGKTLTNTYEWCNEGIEPQITNLQKVPIKDSSRWFNIFNEGGYIHVSDTAELPQDEYHILLLQGIKSILALPLKVNGEIYGFCGFDECIAGRQWVPEDVELLVSLSQIIASAIVRHRTSMELQLSHNTMRTVLDGVNACIFVTDFDTYDVLFANKTGIEQWHRYEGRKCWLALDENQTEPCSFCPHPYLRDEQMRPTGPHLREFYNKNMDKWFECIDLAIEWIDGRQVHLEYTVDVTARKKIEEELGRSKEMYRRLSEASSDAILSCDIKGNLIFVSPRTLQYFRIDNNTSISSLNIVDLIHPTKLNQCQEMFRTIIRDEVDFQPEICLKRQDGTDFFAEISAAIVKDSSGNPNSVIAVIRDITSRKQFEADLIQAKEHAEESDRLKSSFLSNLSHEVRTPLNIITGLVGAIAPTLPKEVRAYGADLTASSTRLRTMIDLVLDAARLETGQMTVKCEPVAIEPIMDEMHRNLAKWLEDSGKDMHIATRYYSPDNCTGIIASADPERLRQIIGILLNNAVKFTEHGHIRFGYRKLSSDAIEFFVEDTGIGIPHSRIDILFKRFQQVSTGNTRIYEGLGLGLSVSYGLVHLMGGNMKVSTTEGRGSAFTFTVRIAQLE